MKSNTNDWMSRVGYHGRKLPDSFLNLTDGMADAPADGSLRSHPPEQAIAATLGWR